MNRFTKIVLGVVALALVVGVAAPVKAQTIDINSLLAQIAALQAQLAALQGGSSTASAVFTMDLGVGSRGAEVTALQNKLGVVPATGYFGPLTKAAVQKYQASKGISATGFVGPMTRAALNAGSTTTTTTTTPVVSTTGAEGTLTVTLNPTPASGVTVYEGDSMVGVLGLKLEAKLSDIRVERVKVNLGTDTAIYNKVFNKIYVTDGSSVLASSDLNSSTVVKDGSNYYITLTGMNVVVPKDGTKVLTVKADVRSSVDSTYRTSYSFQVDTDGVRGTDGAGINQYGPASAITRSVTVSQSLADTATLKVSVSSTNPDPALVIANGGSANNEKDNVGILNFDMRAEKDAVTVTDMTVTVAKTGSGAATATTAYLYDGSTLIGSATVNSSTGLAYFTDIDFTIAKDSTKTITLSVDVRSANTTAAVLTATVSSGTPTSSVAGIAAENSTGTNVAETGSAAGNGFTVFSKGPEITVVSKPITKSATASQNNYSTSTASADFQIKIKAIGGDVTFHQTAGSAFGFGIYQGGTLTTLAVSSSTSFGSMPSTVVANGTTMYTLSQNNEVTVPVTFLFEGRTAAGALLSTNNYAVGVESLAWGISGAATTTSTYMSGKSAWKTSTVSLP